MLSSAGGRTTAEVSDGVPLVQGLHLGIIHVVQLGSRRKWSLQGQGW